MHICNYTKPTVTLVSIPRKGLEVLVHQIPRRRSVRVNVPVSIPRKGLEVLVRSPCGCIAVSTLVSIPRKGLEVLVPVSVAFSGDEQVFQSLGRG